MKRWLLGIGLALLVSIVALALVPMAPATSTVELTRYLWNGSVARSDAQRFDATPGEATLVASSRCDSIGSDSSAAEIALPEITLNDVAVDLVDGSASVTLAASNQIALPATRVVDNCLSVRVIQSAQVTMHVLSRVHFNTNVSNFEQARKFYGMLGFDTLSGFPDTNTQAMARAIGVETPTSYDGSKGDFAGGYLLHGELVGPQGFAGGVIDLIEFTIPKDDAPPYSDLNHLGMARAVMQTSNIAADVDYLTGQGVNFVSEPVARADGSQFAIFHDLDGTSYELRQPAGVESSSERSDAPTHISKLGAVAINVSDFERSRAWYQMLGFRVSSTLPKTESLDVAKAMGFDEPWKIEGAVVTHLQDQSTLELVQWHTPKNAEPPYPLPVNHLGMHRMAFSTSDIASDVETLRQQGVEFVSPITPCCSGDDSWGAIVAFLDPDGTVLELVEQPVMTPLLNLSMRLGALLGSP